MVAGVSRPQLGCTPKDTVWTAGRCRVVALPQRQRDARAAGVDHLQPAEPQLHRRPRTGNSFIEKLLKAGFDVYMLDWGVPDERDSENTFEDYVDDYIPGAVGGSSRSAGPTRSTCSAIAWRAPLGATPRTTPTHRCAALP